MDTIDGADIIIRGTVWVNEIGFDEPGKLYANLTDPVLQNYTDSIKSFVYMTEDIAGM